MPGRNRESRAEYPLSIPSKIKKEEAAPLNDMLPLWETVKNKTVIIGGVFMPQKHKITAEEKVKLVRAYLSGKITQRHAGKVAMVSPATIQVWIKRYEAEGIEAFYPSSTNRVYSPETKTQAVIDYLNGLGSFLYSLNSGCC